MKMRLLSLAIGMALPVAGQAPSVNPKIELLPRHIVGIEYPWFARLGVIQGRVALAAVVGRDGAVKKVRIISGVAPLAAAARESVLKWVFRGCDSDSGTCETNIQFSFLLDDGSCDAGSHCPSQFEIDLPGNVTVSAKRIRAIVN